MASSHVHYIARKIHGLVQRPLSIAPTFPGLVKPFHAQDGAATGVPGLLARGRIKTAEFKVIGILPGREDLAKPRQCRMAQADRFDEGLAGRTV